MRRHSADWWQIIVDLERAGWSCERIAAECLRSKAWVLNLKNLPGTQPRHVDGETLIALWLEVTGSQRQRIPLTVHTVRNP